MEMNFAPLTEPIASIQIDALPVETPQSEARLRYQNLFEQAVDAIFVSELDGHYIEVNSAACSLLGYTRDELLSRRIQDLIPAEEIPRLETGRAILLQGKTDQVELLLRRKDGVFVPVELTARLLSDGYWHAIVRDISERKRKEEALRHAQQDAAAADAKVRGLVEMGPDAVIITDSRGQISLVNHQTEVLFGFTRDELLGRPLELLIPERSREANLALHSQYVANPQVRAMAIHQEVLGRRRDDTIFPAEISLGPVTVDGETLIIATIRDCSERKELEHEVVDHARKLEAANQRLELFVGIVNHELKTPLTSALVLLQLGARRLKRWLPERAAKNRAELAVRATDVVEFSQLCGQLEHQVKRMARLVNDLLDVSRIQANKLELELAPCDLITQVRAVISEQRQTHPGRKIRLRAPKGQVRILADADRIQEVVTNYLTNALKYSEAEQPVEVSVRQTRTTIRVRVRDHGPGIPPEHQTQIWNVFERLEGENAARGTGANLGLGLHICKQLVEQHGGQVGVKSGVGQGSAFWFALPLSTE